MRNWLNHAFDHGKNVYFVAVVVVVVGIKFHSSIPPACPLLTLFSPLSIKIPYLLYPLLSGCET